MIGIKSGTKYLKKKIINNEKICNTILLKKLNFNINFKTNITILSFSITIKLENSNIICIDKTV